MNLKTRIILLLSPVIIVPLVMYGIADYQQPLTGSATIPGSVTTRTLVLVIVGLALAMSAFVIGIINFLVVIPVKQLQITAREIGEGNLDVRSVVHRSDEIGELARSINSMSTNLHETQVELQQMAYRDKLTGLANRRMFLESLGIAIKRAQLRRNKVALLFIDLDEFKSVNDTAGHEGGDYVIAEVANRLCQCLRRDDVISHESREEKVSRLGGDEFTIIISDLDDPNIASIIAERVRTALNKPFEYSNQIYHIGCSIGISIFPNDGREPAELLKNADAAMYSAKLAGKNKYTYFDVSMAIRAIEHHRLKNELHQAFENKEFELYYQPQYDFESGAMVGCEALIRWFPANGEAAISSEVFIPLAEKTGLIIDLGRWVADQACRQSRIWRDAGLDTPKIMINTRAYEFSRVDVVSSWRSLLAAYDLEPSALGIEITESAMMDAGAGVFETLEQIHKMGISISLDDFGTGHSSLAMLIKLPIDNLKVDQSFIDEITVSGKGKAIVTAVIAMSKKLGLTVTAEGVETKEQRDFLRQAQCHFVQGYLYCKPLCAHDMTSLLLARRGHQPAHTGDANRGIDLH